MQRNPMVNKLIYTLGRLADALDYEHQFIVGMPPGTVLMNSKRCPGLSQYLFDTTNALLPLVSIRRKDLNAHYEAVGLDWDAINNFLRGIK